MANPRSLEANVVYQAGEFAHAFHHMLTSGFKRHGISVTVEQFSVLAVLFYQKNINQKQLGILLQRDKTTIARNVATMIKNKLVKRVADKHDQRAKLIYLTDKGTRLQRKSIKISGELYHKAVKNIPEADLKRAGKVLIAMMKNVTTAL